MQDYAHLYRKRYQTEPSRKLYLIRRILRSNVSQSLMLSAILLVAEAASRK